MRAFLCGLYFLGVYDIMTIYYIQNFYFTNKSEKIAINLKEENF